MKQIQYILIIFLLCCMVTSCENEPVNNISYSYLSESIKPYKFKTGTYWIYQNDSTGIIDSVAVISIENGFYWSPPPVHGQPGGESEFYKINMKSFSTSLTFNDYLTNYYIKRDGGGEYGQDGQPIYMSNSEIGTKFNGMEIIAMFPTITINNNTFDNVVETKITASQQYQPVFANDTYLFFSDSIGIIKTITEFGNGNYESWSIKRWNVIK